MTPTKDVQKLRFYGFDLIRFFSFVAIAFFHISLIHYYTLKIPLAENFIIAKGIEIYSRSLAFSGFTILLITSCLTGFSRRPVKKRVGLFSFLCLGWILFSYLTDPYYDLFLAWDIYPLVLFGFLTCVVSEWVMVNSTRGLALIGFFMLWIPFWQFSHFVPLNSWAANVLGFADCRFEIAEWPLLPWIGLIWFGYGLGMELRLFHWGGKSLLSRSPRYGSTEKISHPETVIWVTVLLLSLPQWGAYYLVKLGREFSCDIYRKDPYVFWSHMIWILFFMRLSLTDKVQNVLANFQLVRAVSGLAMSRSFWLAYVSHYLIAHLLSAAAAFLGWMGYGILFIAIVYLPLVEFATRGILLLLDPVKRK